MPIIVIALARNEARNLGEILNRLPAFGTSREVVFVEGGSTDGTRETIEAEIQKRPGRKPAGTASMRARDKRCGRPSILVEAN